MRLYFSFFLLLFSFVGYNQSFLESQKKHSRVKEAFKTYETLLSSDLQKLDVSLSDVSIFLRALKTEQELEIWIKQKKEEKYKLYTTIPFCVFSGGIGPKRKQGDYQIPEGLYHIDRFNPYSNYYLSMGINYPNASDKILGEKGRLGGDIFIHGNCVSIGCISITDPFISKLYVLAVHAKNNGQKTIPVHVFPFKMNEATLNKIEKEVALLKPYLPFWKNLLPFYTYFEREKKLPSFKVNEKGQYILNQ